MWSYAPLLNHIQGGSNSSPNLRIWNLPMLNVQNSTQQLNVVLPEINITTCRMTPRHLETFPNETSTQVPNGLAATSGNPWAVVFGYSLQPPKKQSTPKSDMASLYPRRTVLKIRMFNVPCFPPEQPRNTRYELQD